MELPHQAPPAQATSLWSQANPWIVNNLRRPKPVTLHSCNIIKEIMGLTTIIINNEDITRALNKWWTRTLACLTIHKNSR